MKKLFGLFMLVLAMGAFASAGTKVSWNIEYEPASFDPQKLIDIQAMNMASACMEGLTRIGKNGVALPAAAESWSVKGTTWTFKLRNGLKWANGTPVTAQDFYFGIKRGIEPETGAEYAYMTYYIKNAQAYNEGKLKDFTKVGVKVVDDMTISYELEGPTPFFPSIVGSLPIYYPVSEKFYNENKSNFYLDTANVLANGPYLMKEWQHEQSVTFVKNPTYWNAKNIKIDELNFFMLKDATTAANMYRNNEIDATYISGKDLPSFAGSKEITRFAEGSTYYLEFNTKDKVFSNEKIRKAIGYVIDRKILTDKILRDGSLPARSFVPTGFPGKKKTFREDYGMGYFNDGDVAAAKKLYAEGLKELGLTKLKVKLTCDNNEVIQKVAQYIQEQVSSKLGAEIVLEPVTKQIRLKNMGQREYEFAITRWGADYLDPMTFMDLHLSASAMNYSSWDNKKFDSLIEKSQMSEKTAERMDAMAEAEKLMISEMPVAPLYFTAKNIAIKPHVKNVLLLPAGNNVEFYNAYIKK